MRKRYLSWIPVFLLILSLAGCSSAAAATPPGVGMTGGWEIVPAEAAPLPEAAQRAFDKAVTAQEDAAYIPVALLSTQIVAGTNFCIFCQVTPEEENAAPFWALVYIYADLQGNAEITNVYDLDIPRHWS